MPITVVCPNCREALEIPNDLVGGDVRCGSCLEIFKAMPAGGDVPPPLPREARNESRRGGDRDRNEPRRKNRAPVSRADDGYGEIEYDPDRKRKQGVTASLWILFLVLGLMGCGCCGGLAWFSFDMVDPKYKAFTPPDGKFVAQFPAAVRNTTRATGRKDGEMAPAHEAARPMMRETFFVYHVELTPEEKKDPVKTANKLCDGVVKNHRGTVQHRTENTHQGFDCVEVHIKVSKNQFVRARTIAAEDRGYVLGVIVQQDPVGMFWIDHFFDGFEIKTAEKPEKQEKPDAEKPGAPPRVKAPAPKVKDDDDN